MMRFLVVIGVLMVPWLMHRSARRFANRQRRLGRWDAQGPLVETAAPRGNHGMNERLEVEGIWHGEVLRDRRPDTLAPGAAESSDASQQSDSEPPT
jgi:hypothetical protein